jgi:general L-amino acid transport system permease protein
VFNAVARPDNAACRAIGHEGACWGVIAEKYRLILFGALPVRRAVAAAGRHAPHGRAARGELLPQVLEALAPRRVGVVLVAFFVLMHGGVLGLTPVETARWGGFPLTIMLSTIGLACAFRSPSWWRSGAAPACPASGRCASSTSS